MASEIWDVEESTPKVQVLINGEQVGEVEQSGLAGAVIERYASQHGLRKFTAYTDGQVYHNTSVNRTAPLSGVSTLELVAKDAQG